MSGAPAQRAKSARLVAGEAVADVHATAGERRSEQSGKRFGQEKLTVHQLIRRGAKRYVNEHRDGAATMSVQSVLAKTTLCRTEALGGRWYQCDDCDRLTKRHNSCGDRHCPQCSGGKRHDFADRTSKLILDGVDYYQVVFTLPGVISTMALANRQEIAELLFHSAWKALKKSVQTEQHYELTALMVRHTWNQKLDAHWHVHALVPTESSRGEHVVRYLTRYLTGGPISD